MRASAALYSQEFYELARTRLKPGGYLSQWLPAYQVPAETSLAMVRAFIDVFPQSVLLSGTQAELLLVGTSGAVDRDRPGAARTRARTRAQGVGRSAAPRPWHGDGNRRHVRRVRGHARPRHARPAAGVGRSSAAGVRRPLGSQLRVERCAGGAGRFAGRGGVVSAMLRRGQPDAGGRRSRYVPRAARRGVPRAGRECAHHRARCAGGAESSAAPTSAAILPDNDAVHNVIGVTLLREARYDEAAHAFRAALDRRADSPDANRNLGTALAAAGRAAEAIAYLRRAVQLAPDNGGAQYELGNLLLAQREFKEAANSLQVAVRKLPDFAPAHNSLGIALASLGRADQAVEEFRQATTLDPTFDAARRNLEASRPR